MNIAEEIFESPTELREPKPNATGAWTKPPAALPPELPLAPALPAELIPEPLRPWICDISERMQVPLDFVAPPAVTALSSVVGRSVGIRPKRHDSWLVVPNLWGELISRPGLQKSPAVAEATKPLRRLAHAAQKEFEANSADAKAKTEILKLQLEAAKQDAKEAVKKGSGIEVQQDRIAQITREMEQSEPKERRYMVNDSTVEKLGELLKENPRGLLLFRDELIGFLRTLDKTGREADRAFYLEAWGGDGSFDYDRIGRGTIHVPAVTVSIFGNITPGRLRSYISGALDGGGQDDGLLQRFQVAVWPEIEGEWRNVDRYPDTEAKNLAFEVFQAFDMLDPAPIGAVMEDGEIPYLRFTPDAQELFDEWRAKLERRLRGGELSDSPGFESHLAKYRSLMPSLALIFHLADVVSAQVTGPISLGAAILAADWCEYLEAHARKIYSPELRPDVTAAHRLADKIRSGAITDGMTIREVYRPQWSGLSDADTVSAGLDLLARHNWVRVVERDTGGRATEVIEVHPSRRVAAA